MLLPFAFLARPGSGTWETQVVDNEAEFLQAFGSAFSSGAPGVVRSTELHSIAHDREAGVLEDTLLLGDTALTNRTVVGVPCEIVGPDGAAMTAGPYAASLFEFTVAPPA